eukprot:8444341-Alexandrium_andersonii.AAC.1
MSASLVGSEMCIRDSRLARRRVASASSRRFTQVRGGSFSRRDVGRRRSCLLYTSDAADDM